MSDNKKEMMLQEENNHSVEPEVVDVDKENAETEGKEDNDKGDAFLTDDFKCGELLLDADEDRAAFKLFLGIATDDSETEKKRKDAIDKMLYVALKNSDNADLLENETWKKIKKLSNESKEGDEYADLLMHFRYYAKGGKEENEVAYKYLEKYSAKLKNNQRAISPIADLQMGKCLDFGVGIPAEKVDAAKAIEYYQKALDGGCLAAYKYIVCSLIFGGEKLEKDEEKAKNELKKAIDLFKKQFKEHINDLKPFFEALVGCCFSFQNKKIRKKMFDKGKKLAQYMIDHNIKGGYRLMGDYFLYSINEFNITMAKNYYQEAIKNNEGAAYGQLAMINSFEENQQEETFKLANKGCFANDSFSFTRLGEMYEKLGKKEKGEKKKKYLLRAWDYYEKAYYKFGLYPEKLGRLYLDFGVLPKGYHLEELERVLEIGAKQFREEAIKCYLGLILKKSNKEVKDSDINSVTAKIYGDKYQHYMKLGALYTNDVYFKEKYIENKKAEDNNFLNNIDDKTQKLLYQNLSENPYLTQEQIEFIYKNADDESKSNVTEFVIEQPYIEPENIKLVYKNADDASKEKFTRHILKRHFVFADQIISIYEHADEDTKRKLTNKLLKKPYLLDKDDLNAICDNTDTETQVRLFNKIMKESNLNNDQIAFIYEHADEETQKRLTVKLLEKPYLLDRDDLESIYNNSDAETKAKLFEKIIKEDYRNNDQIDFIYEHADEKTKEEFSKKLISESYITSSKKQFVDVFNNYEGEQDISFIRWFSISSAHLFINENKDEYIKLINGIKKGIEKSKDESLKELWMSWQSNIDKAVGGVIEEIDDETIKKVCGDYRKDDGYTDWEAIINSLSKLVVSGENDSKEEKYEIVLGKIKDVFLSELQNQSSLMNELLYAINNSNDEGLKKMYEKYNEKFVKFIESCFPETDDESSGSSGGDIM